MDQALIHFLVGVIFTINAILAIRIIRGGPDMPIRSVKPKALVGFIVGLFCLVLIASLAFLVLVASEDRQLPTGYWPVIAGIVLGWKFSDYLLILIVVLRKRLHSSSQTEA
jgi:hypothetical protein